MEGSSHPRRRRTLKRQRWQCLALGVLAVGSSSSRQVQGFSALTPPVLTRKTPRVDAVSDVVEEVKTEVHDGQISRWKSIATEGTAELPPWLSRYESSTESLVGSQQRWLEYELAQHGFSNRDAGRILKLLQAISIDDVPLRMGLIDFLRLFLSLRYEENSVLVSTDMLLASVLHYAECVSARRQGMQERIADTLNMPPSIGQTSGQLTLSEDPTTLDISSSDESTDQQQGALVPVGQPLSPMASVGGLVNEDVLAIADGAGRLKRAEIVAQAVLGDDRALSDEEAKKVTDFLLSCMDDWRSLTIRVVASLYRLKGLKVNSDGGASLALSSMETKQTARSALKIFSILAQRLGMDRFKSLMQEEAFRILYSKQYQAAKAFYSDKVGAMHALSTVLLRQVTASLHEDSVMEQLEDLQIKSRVKEPFSFWKKLLKSRSPFLRNESELSVVDVADGIALRVVLRARKLDPDEREAFTDARERYLCYYVHKLLRMKFPPTSPDRVKDYISQPKPNGYQSLHHTSCITFGGLDFPFEIQVRSEKMHRSAEFGLAAHWDYKVGPGTESSSAPNTSGLIVRPTADEGGLTPYVDSLLSSRDGIVGTQVHVFVAATGGSTSRSKLLSMPPGSTVGDVLTSTELDVGKLDVWKNGRRTDLGDSISNGDILLVQTSASTKKASALVLRGTE